MANDEYERSKQAFEGLDEESKAKLWRLVSELGADKVLEMVRWIKEHPGEEPEFTDALDGSEARHRQAALDEEDGE
jgi:hypothetical protein